MVRRAQADFECVAPIRREHGAVGCASAAELFGVLEQQLGTVEAAVARPSNVAEQVQFAVGAVHAVQRQRFGRDDFHAGVFAGGIAVVADALLQRRAHRRIEQ